MITEANLEVVNVYSGFPKGSSWGESFNSVGKSAEEWKPIVLVVRK